MDSFQGKPESAEQISDTPSPIFVADVSGDVRIQLEGSHTSASVTESETPSQSKYVKFEDELNDRQLNKDLTSSHNTMVQLNTETDNAEDVASCTGRIPHKLWGAVDIIPRSSRRAEQQCDEWQSVQMQELKQIGKENKEITERFRQIMDMFDTFTRNLETLEPRAIGVKNRGNVVISDVAGKSILLL